MSVANTSFGENSFDDFTEEDEDFEMEEEEEKEAGAGKEHAMAVEYDGYGHLDC